MDRDKAQNSIITVEDITVEDMDSFWKEHIEYLQQDEIISDEEDVEYFSGDEYRGILIAQMTREKDRHHAVHFIRNGVAIGAAHYNTYQSEDGKCFIMDYWVYPQYRGNGTGHACFKALEAYTKADGALYYELNSEKENSIRFWKSMGFAENGVDEYDMELFIKR